VSAPSRILVRGVNWLGDAVISGAALAQLKRAQANSTITLFCPEKLASLWQHHPAVQQVVGFPADTTPLMAGKLLRQQDFDLGLLFPNSFRSALEIWLAGVRKRIGYGGGGRGFLLTERVARPAQRTMRKKSDGEIKALIASGRSRQEEYSVNDHHIFHYLNLISALTCEAKAEAPQLFVSQEEVQSFARKWKLDRTVPLFGMNPGAEYGPAKRWPLERFAETAILVNKQRAGQWLVFGGANDKPLGEELCARLRSAKIGCTDLTGATTLRELMAGLKLCTALLTNDTGPMHVAAALGTGVVVPFGSTSPELTGPGLPGVGSHELIKGAAPCAPCFRRECPVDFRCMRSIEAEEVAVRFLQRVSG
jgi:heptosyltransferase-2